MYVVINFLFQLIFVLSIFTIIVIALSSGCLHADIYSKGASHDKRPGSLGDTLQEIDESIKHLLSESWLFIIVMVIITAIVIFIIIIIITGIIIITIIIGSSKFSITLFFRFLYPTPLFSFFSHSFFKPQIPIT